MHAPRPCFHLAAASLAIALAAASGARAQTYLRPGVDNTPARIVRAQVVANVLSIAPGEAFDAGVRLSMADTWHVNWINPGDAGLAPSVSWTMPKGFVAGPIEWPLPARHEAGPLVIFGYDGDVLLTMRIHVPEDVAVGSTVTLTAGVDWLACQEACVPGDTTLALSLPVETVARPNDADADAFAEAARLHPVDDPGWGLSARYSDDQILIGIQPAEPDLPAPAGVFFFPTEPGVVENAGAQELRTDGRGYELQVNRSRMVGALPARLTGVLVSKSGWGRGGAPLALAMDVALEPR